jgi:hypothetical protein
MKIPPHLAGFFIGHQCPEMKKPHFRAALVNDVRAD